jgi:hypothetical protein
MKMRRFTHLQLDKTARSSVPTSTFHAKQTARGGDLTSHFVPGNGAYELLLLPLSVSHSSIGRYDFFVAVYMALE